MAPNKKRCADQELWIGDRRCSSGKDKDDPSRPEGASAPRDPRKLTGPGRLGGSVKLPTLDFSSGYDLIVREFKPCIGLCTDSAEPAWDSLSPSLSLPLPHLHSFFLSLKINIKKKRKKKKLTGVSESSCYPRQRVNFISWK